MTKTYPELRLSGGQDVALGCSLEDCAMLKSHFYKGARILVKDGEVKRLEIRVWSNMYGPLHEMELTPLINVTAFPQLYCTCSVGGDEEIGAIQLWDEVQKVLLTKYRIDFHYIPFLRGEDKLIFHFSWESQETILANEEKDSYYYLRKYPDYYRTQFFEGIYKPTPTGPVKYSKLVYKTSGKVIPFLGENKGNEI